MESRSDSKDGARAMNDNFNWLIPRQIGLRKKRFGCDQDGAYIYPIDVRVDALLSYGAGSDISFELAFRKEFNVPIIICDPTVDVLPTTEDTSGITFVHEGVASTKSNQYDTIDSHISRFGLSGKRLALKMDVEGAEWNAFDSFHSFDSIDVLIMELHDLCYQPRALLPIMGSKFECFHVHGNNYCGISYGLPNTVEATFISRRILVATPDMSEYPGEFDRPNNPATPDIPCRWWK